MQDILSLMFRLEKLKRTARAGWNKSFPPDHRFKTRSVSDAESVADHSWSLAMFALAVGPRLNVDTPKLVHMALIHDIAELVTLDIVTAHLEPVEKTRLEAEKRVLEECAMREIFSHLGQWGELCYQLWLEYEDQTSPEALILKQLDYLEACVQAHSYQEQGHTVIPEEFFGCTESILTHPEITPLLNILRDLASNS